MTITKVSRKFSLIFCGIALLSCTPASAQSSLRPFNAIWSERVGPAHDEPPPEFDHPVDPSWHVEIYRNDIDGVRFACNRVKLKVNHIVAGCAVINVTKQTCFVHILNDEILLRYGRSYDDAWRHERGHCNGWRHPEKYVDGPVRPAAPIQPVLQDITVSTPTGTARTTVGHRAHK